MKLNSPSILIVGAGYLGEALGLSLIKHGHAVSGIIRSEEKAVRLRSEGFNVYTADLKQASTLKNIPYHDGVILCPSPGKNQTYEEIYLHGISNILFQIKTWQKKPSFVIHVSSIGVWKNLQGKKTNEQTPVSREDAKSKILIDSEQMTLGDKGGSGMILRLGGIYGPERNRIENFQKNLWPKSDSEDHYINLIHREDAVSAIQRLMDKGIGGEIYIGVDDEPALESEIYKWFCDVTAQQKRKNPFSQLAVTSAGKRCQNTKLKALGWRPQYPTFREGYRPLLP